LQPGDRIRAACTFWQASERSLFFKNCVLHPAR
jgi:hypothetical protein